MIEHPVSLRRNPDLGSSLGTSKYLEQIVSGVKTAVPEMEINVNQKIGWKHKACLTSKPAYKVTVISFLYVKEGDI